MIKYKTGNIFDEDVEAIVNTVNCIGVMGRGIALQYKKTFPGNFKAYEIACKQNEVEPGKMLVYERDSLTNPKFIINFPTKKHWREKSHIEYIEKGLIALKEEIKKRNIKSIALPPLGSGLGGLNWNEVKKHIEGSLALLQDVEIVIFEPQQNKSASKNIKSSTVPKMTTGRAALICLINRYLGGLMDPFVTLLEIHKLMYFMQDTGEPLKLQFAKGPRGPYAENLRHVLSHIEGYFTSGYSDGGDNPDKNIELIEGALETAKIFLADKHTSTTNNLDKVNELVDGFETPSGLEILSTVHWVIKQDKAKSLEEVIEKVYLWNDSKKQFSKYQITIAYETLQQKEWIN